MTITYRSDITAECVRERLYYNPENGVFVWTNPPYEHRRLAGKIAGSNRAGYLVIKLNGFGYMAHRIAWLYVYGAMPAGRINHADGDKLNNRLANIRIATPAQNCANAARKAGKQTPKGVRKLPSGRYQARIKHSGIMRTIGTFNSHEAAAIAYFSESQRLNGEFARLS